ncbi:unnamed protein product, partial [Musa banksii]
QLFLNDYYSSIAHLCLDGKEKTCLRRGKEKKIKQVLVFCSPFRRPPLPPRSRPCQDPQDHLKAKRLEELATEIKKHKDGSKEMQITDEDTKGKKVLDSIVEIRAEGSSVLPRGDMESGVSSQENLDVLLAASLAAEEEMEINKNVLTYEGGLDEAEDDNEEMIFPMDNIHIDPAVLASLPPSMQLDLLVQMRESIIAENRQKYQKIKKV